MGSSNTFSRAMKHLKADKPSGLFESVPTNNTQDLYQVEPDTLVEINPDIDVPDFNQDGDGSSTYTGEDTSGLFMPDGTIRVIEPPGNTTAILGPMATMWYAWGNFSTFGYIRQSDRRMVNLGRIDGKLSDWDGVSNFTSYNTDFTIDQAVWFRDTPKYGGVDNDPANHNYRAFYPGPPSNVADQYGRYLCSITGTPKNQTTGVKGPKVGPDQAGFPWIGVPSENLTPEQKKKREEYAEYLNDLMSKAPGTLTPEEEQALIDAGLDDFVKGGNTQSPLGDLAMLGLTFAGVKAALASGVGSFLSSLGLGKLGLGKATLASLGVSAVAGAEKAGYFGNDANNAGDYNTQLAGKLVSSILSGQPQEIKLSDSAARSQITSLDPSAVEEYLTIGGKAHEPSAQTTVNPTQGKKGPLFGDSDWGVQGASEIHYDPATDTLTITSEKTLRTTSGGNTVTTDDTGKITSFSDIPSPSDEKVAELTGAFLNHSVGDTFMGMQSNIAQILSNPPNSSNFTGGPIPGVEQPYKPTPKTWDEIKNNPEDLKNFIDGFVPAIQAVSTGGVQGTASNVVAIRSALTNLGLPQSEVEQIGGAFGQVYSQTNYSGADIPNDIRNIINNQTKTESFKPLPRLPRRTNKVSSVNESHTLDVIKNVKKPVSIEEKKEKVKRRPRVIGSEPRTLNTGLMKQAEVPASFKKPEERMWGKYEREQNARASQDRKNVVLDHLGNADQAWEYLLDRNAGKRSFAGYFEKDGTPRTIFTDGKVKTVTREEKVGTDTLIFFTDEEGKSGSILQSEYNELQDQSQAQQMFAEYEATVGAAKEEENDFDRIANKLELKAEKNPTNDKIQSMLSSYRALSHLKKEDKKNEAHFVSWKSTIDGKITDNLQSWIDSVGQETADAVSVAEAMTSGDMFVRTQLEPTGEEIRVPVPSDSFRYNQSDAVTTTDGVVKFGEVAPHNYDSQYWWRQTASTNYITTTDVPGEQTVTHVTFDVDLGTGIDAPLPNHPLKVEYQMIYRASDGTTYNAGTGTLGSITAGGKTSFELPQYHEFYEISFDLTVDGTWMRSYELDYQRRMFVGTTLAGATLTADDVEDNIGPIAMILDVLRHPGGFDDDADTTMHVLLFNGFSSRISGLPGGSQGSLGSDREYLFNLIRSQYAHLRDRYALTYTINSMGLTRVAPITVWVPLDSPEAVSFMRTAPEMAGLTPAQRLKKLKEMLKSGNEYLIKMLGYQGSTATPGPNEPADYLDGADELLNDVSPEEQAEIEKNLAKLGPEYAKLAAIPAALPLLASPAGQAALAAGAAAVGTLLIKAGIDINNTMQSSADWDYGDSAANEQEAQPSSEAEMKERQRGEAQAADKAIKDAIDQYGADSEEAREAIQAKNDTLTKHKKERKSIGGKDDRGKGKESSGMTSRGDTKSGTNDTWYGEQVTRKGRYLSDSKTFKKQSFSKWYGSMESDTADKVISDAKIETKDQVLELVFDEFNRLRLQEGMTSKGFEYIYGLAVSNIVSQYGIDSKFASDLLHASADTTDYEFGPNFPGSYVNSIGDYEVDSSRRINVNAYYDSKFGSVSGSGGNFTLRTLDGPSGASVSQLNSALGISLPSGIAGALGGSPVEGSAVQRIFTGAQPGNIINFNWGFTSSEKGLPQDLKVDDYAFVAITGRVTKFVSILQGGDVRGGSFRYRLKPGDIDGNGNVKVAIGIVDVFDRLYNTTLRVNSFGSLYAGEIGTIGDTTDAADLGTSVNNLNPNKRKRPQQQQPSYMNIQVGDQQVVKVNNRTVTDTSRGIRDGQMDGRPIYYDNQGNMRVSQPRPQPKPQSNRTNTSNNTSSNRTNTSSNNRTSVTRTTQFTPEPMDGGTVNPNLAARGLRSATDQMRYSGNKMFQGNPAGRAPGLSNYWSPDPATAGTYSNPGAGKGVPGAKPNPTGTITTAPRPANTPRVTRSPLGQPQFKFPAGSPPPANMITQMADDAAVSAGKRAAATTAGKALGRAVPFVSAGIAVADAGIRASKGDYAGAVLSGVSAIPGPIGWAGLGVQIATDAAGITGVREQKEFTDYSDYLKNAGELAKKNNIELDRNAMLDSFLRQIAKSKQLSNNDKSFLVAIFTDAEGLEKDDVVDFVKSIQKKLSSKN